MKSVSALLAAGLPGPEVAEPESVAPVQKRVKRAGRRRARRIAALVLGFVGTLVLVGGVGYTAFEPGGGPFAGDQTRIKQRRIVSR